MRILFTLHNFFPEKVFGAEWVCIQQMRELLRRGHHVALFYAGNRPVSTRRLIENGLAGLHCFPVNYLNTKGQVLLSVKKPHVTRRFRAAVERFSPDAVIYHHLVRLSLDLPAVSFKKQIPSLLVLHDFYLSCPSYSLLRPDNQLCSGGGLFKCAACLFGSRFRRLQSVSGGAALLAMPVLAMRERMIRRLMDHISCFVSPSRFLIQKLNDLGIFPAPVAYIPNGCEPAKAKKKFALIDPGRLRFGYMGSIIKKKGLDLLVSAFDGDLGKQLTIRGFADDQAVNQFRRNHPDFQATLELFDPDKTSFFENVDVVIVPSIWYENQPAIIIEAFSYGKPVICSDCGAFPEMVADNVSGLLFKTGDAGDLKAKIDDLNASPLEILRLAAGISAWPSVSDNVDKLLDHIMMIRRRWDG